MDDGSVCNRAVRTGWCRCGSVCSRAVRTGWCG